MNRVRALLLVALGFVAVGCPAPGDDTGPGDDTTTPGDPILCEESVLQCPLGQGCHDEVCGSCENADECHDLEGCRDDGSCGACEGEGDCREDEACREGFCLPAELPTWELTMAPEDWTEIDAHPQDEIYVPCELTAFGVHYDGELECRLHGGTTRSYPKRSFRIVFPENADHPGFSRKITLRAEYNDPSFLRTVLGYEAFRRLTPLPTPRARYVRLDLNGEYYGLMVEVERIRGLFLELRGRDRDQSLWEPEHVDDHGALTPNGTLAEYQEIYEKQAGDEDDWSDLVTFVEQGLVPDWQRYKAGGNWSLLEVPQRVHLDSYLQYLAVNAALQNQDHVTNNFLFSWQDLGSGYAWEFYPEDFDVTMGCLWDSENQDTICDDFRYDGWWLNGLIPDGIELGVDEVWANLLIHLVLANPTTEARYTEELCDVLGGAWWNQGMPDLITALDDTIREAVADDPNDMSEGLDRYDEEQAEVRDFLELRRDYLLGSLGCAR